MKCKWYVLTAIALFVVALGLLLYPLIGELVSEKYHSDVETTYTAAIEDTDDAELTAQRQAAEQYNAMLADATIFEGGASAPPLAYTEQLTVGGAMAYIDIPKIGVYLPVQHGTGADTGTSCRPCNGHISAGRRQQYPCGAIGPQWYGKFQAVFGHRPAYRR